jgi:ureidoglycolate lyase
MNIDAIPLIPESFSPFGQVIMGNGKTPERAAFAAKIENHRAEARLNVTYLHINPMQGPISIEAMERHPYSNQIFVPLNGTRHLIIVCPSTRDGEPDISELKAYTAEGTQTVNYYAGVWHAPRTAIGGTGEFIMLRWDDGTNHDEELRLLDAEIEINLA